MSGSWSLAFGTLPKLHGYSVSSSECASTITVTVFALAPVFVSFSPNSAARWPSGAKSVRSTWSPAASGNCILV